LASDCGKHKIFYKRSVGKAGATNAVDVT